MSAPLLRFDDLSISFGARPLLHEAELSIEPGERVCIVGRNGEGKSTLLKLAQGELLPDVGGVWRRPQLRVAVLAQDAAQDQAQDRFLGKTLDVSTLVRSAFADLPSPPESWEQQTRTETVLSRLKLQGEARFEALSGGWRRRALLARALVVDPELLLLDEPTNHLDIDTIEWLEQQLLEFRGALLVVSHDRAFVNRVATRVIDLDRGALSSWPGNYDDYAAKKAAQLANEAREQALFDKKLAQEEVWIRKGVEARRTRNEGRVRALQSLRAERQARRDRPGSAEMALQESDRSAELIFEAENAAVELGGRTIFRDFSTRVLRGERIGIVGPNGAGKSTLIRLVLGELAPSIGTVRRGGRLAVAYYDQQRMQLDLNASVMHNINADSEFVRVNGEERHVTSYLRDFLFRDEQLRTPAGALSGGERNRLLLARLFAQPANFLVLDEPTNDLDIDTLELLQEQVANFAGTLLVVSHDRRFLDEVVTSLWVLEGDGRVQDFVGGYSDWARWRAQGHAQQRLTANASVASAQAPAPAQPNNNALARRKLSYHEQRELAQWPEKLESLEQSQRSLQQEIAHPQFYQRPHAEVAQKLEQLASLDQAIHSAYERWALLDAVGK